MGGKWATDKSAVSSVHEEHGRSCISMSDTRVVQLQEVSADWGRNFVEQDVNLGVHLYEVFIWQMSAYGRCSSLGCPLTLCMTGVC